MRLPWSQIADFTITIKYGTELHKIPFGDIFYIEALGDYSKFITRENEVITLSKLKYIQEKLPNDKFTRIHRSNIVSNNKIQKLIGSEIYLKKKKDDSKEIIKLPIGKTYRISIKKSI